MEKKEIYIIYGTAYEAMTMELLETVQLASHMKETLSKRLKESVIAGGDSAIDTATLCHARIGIKPNLVAPVEACDGATTHPEVVRGLINYLKKHGFDNLAMLESSWVGDRTEDAFSLCGYKKLVEETGAEFLDMKKFPGIPVDCAGLELKICQPALEVDYLINVPVMKGHCQTRMTCALKNMKGLLPDSEKRAFHRMGLHDPIGHLSAGIHQDFVLVDSICGDLSFEDGGNPVEQNRIFAGFDPVLIDTYCCNLMQIPTNEVPYISIAENCGCGSTDLAHTIVKELHPENNPAREMVVGKALRVSALAVDVESCSACYGNLIPAMYRLAEEGILPEALAEEEKIRIGQGCQGKDGMLGVGNCTRRFTHTLKGCPPKEEEIYEFLKAYYTK